MDKANILRTLYRIADFNLLGAGSWPARREFAITFRKMMIDLGLSNTLPSGDSYDTPLGMQLNVQLMTVFAGAWSVWDIPEILEDNGYLQSEEANAIWEVASEDEGRQLIHRYVLRAYIDFCNGARFFH
jgi:hypothetical protein